MTVRYASTKVINFDARRYCPQPIAVLVMSVSIFIVDTVGSCVVFVDGSAIIIQNHIIHTLEKFFYHLW